MRSASGVLLGSAAIAAAQWQGSGGWSPPTGGWGPSGGANWGPPSGQSNSWGPPSGESNGWGPPSGTGNGWANGGYPHGGGWGQHLPGEHPPASGVQNSTFEQPIDHSNPSLGTFSQFYYYDTQYWKGPGSPVVFFTPGEVNVTGYTNYLTTNRTTGVVAEKIGAATVVIEHRYWGVSSPYGDLSTENMKYLTLENAIADLINFAKNAKLPFAEGFDSNADAVPWVLMGGSYSGALSAWTASVSPGTVWAYQASSAPVQAISNYYGYFLPVQEGMPANCSKDVTLVVDYMDNILVNGTDDEINALKTKFMMENVTHNDDFMAALENGPWLWQGNQFYENQGFFTWCDYIENSVNVTDPALLPGADGVGLEKALEGYAQWWTEVELPGFCEAFGYYNGTYNLECFDTYDPTNPMFTDTSLSNTVDRQWVWMTCNQPFGYWQDGAPLDRPTIVSRLVDAEYWIRQCGLFFPPAPDGTTYGIAAGRTEAGVNSYTGGWFIDNTTRLVYTNGQFDPWREAGVSSNLRPGGPLQSTPQVPVNIVPGGYHTSDLVTKNGEVNPGVQAVINAEVNQLVEWVAEWPKRHQWWA